MSQDKFPPGFLEDRPVFSSQENYLDVLGAFIDFRDGVMRLWGVFFKKRLTHTYRLNTSMALTMEFLFVQLRNTKTKSTVAKFNSRRDC